MNSGEAIDLSPGLLSNTLEEELGLQPTKYDVMLLTSESPLLTKIEGPSDNTQEKSPNYQPRSPNAAYESLLMQGLL